MYTYAPATEKIDMTLRLGQNSNEIQTYQIIRTAGDIYSITIELMAQVETLTLT